MPQLGESIAEATIIDLLVAEGDSVTEGQDIIEVETQKATMNVTAPCDGVIGKYTVEVGESYAVGDVLGQVQAEGEKETARPALKPNSPVPAAPPSRLLTFHIQPRLANPLKLEVEVVFQLSNRPSKGFRFLHNSWGHSICLHE